MEATPNAGQLSHRVEALVRRVGKGAAQRALGCSKHALDRARAGQPLTRANRIVLEQALDELAAATATNERTEPS